MVRGAAIVGPVKAAQARTGFMAVTANINNGPRHLRDGELILSTPKAL
jgi:hypothetical protein